MFGYCVETTYQRIICLVKIEIINIIFYPIRIMSTTSPLRVRQFLRLNPAFFSVKHVTSLEKIYATFLSSHTKDGNSRERKSQSRSSINMLHLILFLLNNFVTYKIEFVIYSCIFIKL